MFRIQLNRWKGDGTYVKIVGANLVLTAVMLLLIIANGVYLKNNVKNSMENEISEALTYVSNAVQENLSTIDISARSLSINTDIVLLHNAILNRDTSNVHTQLDALKKKLMELNRLLPYDSYFYVYFNQAGYVVGADGTRYANVFEKKLQLDSPGFACDCIDNDNNGKIVYIADRFILNSYPMLGIGRIFVQIGKSSLREFLNESASLMNYSVEIRDRDGQLFVKSDPTHKEASNTIRRKFGEFDYTLLYAESALQEKLKTANAYTMALLAFILLINSGFLLLNIKIYNPIKKTIASLNMTASSMKQMISGQKDIKERNALLHLAMGSDNQAIEAEYVSELNDKYGEFYVIANVIEDNEGEKDAAANRSFEQLLSGHVPFQKLMHRPDVFLYMVYQAGDKRLPRIIADIYEHLNIDELFLLCGISEPQRGVERIGRAIRQSLQAIDDGLFTPGNAYHVNGYEGRTDRKEPLSTLSIEKEQELIAYVIKGNTESTSAFFASLFPHASKKLSFQNIRGLYRYLSDLLRIIIESKNINPERLTKKGVSDFSLTFNLEYIHNALHEQYLEVAAFSQNQDTTLYEKTVRYIDQNYMKDLSLTFIAEQFHISPTYLSGYFKKHSGINIIHYLNSVRIQEAIKLMTSNQSLSVNQVAERVGYTNANTFIRQFKRFAGTTTTNYFKKT